jgi:hypothetical protein
MRRLLVAVLVCSALCPTLSAQIKRPPVARPPTTVPPTGVPPAVPAVTTVVPEMMCPSLLGIGVMTKVSFCDVMTERDPAAGIVITLPPHSGPVTLTFTLHNRHTYSEEQVKANRAYARYTATVGVLTKDNTLISRAVVQSEFRNAGDLVDRIAGGAGGGIKAVAPSGAEPITISIPEGEDQVSILGEKLTHERLDGSATYTSPGRPVAVISHVMIEYRPPLPPKPKPVVRKRR